MTLYPFLNDAEPGSIDAGYLDPLFNRIGDIPVAITETGWPAEDYGDLNPLWVTSEQAQVDYLSWLNSVLGGRDVPVVSWLFLHPMTDPGGSPDDWKVFGSVSLRNSAGQKRMVFDPFVEFLP